MQQSRKELKTLKAAARAGDADAARQLLAHSIALGHYRLSVRRYFAAVVLGAQDLDRFRPFCRSVVRQIGPDQVAIMAREAVLQPSLNISNASEWDLIAAIL
ncbi:MAG: hypothetical protein J0H40_01390 [Rhizobiales bacterium]|nr:hypothetical protein [Hyphomicrobiales bacterium]